METPRQLQWQNILQMTEQLHQLLAEENWQAMTEMESQRFTELESFFSSQILNTEIKQVEAGIRQIMKSDELLKQHSISQQKNMSTNLKKIATGRQAIKAYGDV